MIHDLLTEAAARSPDTPFVIGPPRQYTYAEAAELQWALAAQFVAIDRLAVHARDSAHLVLLLCASSAAGAEPCVLNRDAAADECRALIQLLDLPVLVTDSDLRTAAARTIPLEMMVADAQTRPSDRTAGGAKPADAGRLLILTTGTTGLPKAARYTWARLVAQAKRKPEWAGSRWLLAYHLNHFAGLHLLVHVLANAATLVIPDSPDVADAARAIAEHRVECVSGTPTFWRMLLSHLTPDESRRLPVRQITLGGEAVPADLLEKLRHSFPGARISQVFATTEIGSCFSVRDLRDGLPVSLLSRDGQGGVRFKIVDNELHVLSAHGMLGYEGDAEQTPQPLWRATGDLVEVRGDRIHFVGRKSETINVGGVKVHPLPVEQAVQAVPGVRAVHCYGRKNAVTGQVVALDVEAEPGADVVQLDAAIRAACESLSPHSGPALIRFVESLETVNRKVMRRPQ